MPASQKIWTVLRTALQFIGLLFIVNLFVTIQSTGGGIRIDYNQQMVYIINDTLRKMNVDAGEVENVQGMFFKLGQNKF